MPPTEAGGYSARVPLPILTVSRHACGLSVSTQYSGSRCTDRIPFAHTTPMFLSELPTGENVRSRDMTRTHLDRKLNFLWRFRCPMKHLAP